MRKTGKLWKVSELILTIVQLCNFLCLVHVSECYFRQPNSILVSNKKSICLEYRSILLKNPFVIVKTFFSRILQIWFQEFLQQFLGMLSEFFSKECLRKLIPKFIQNFHQQVKKKNYTKLLGTSVIIAWEIPLKISGNISRKIFRHLFQNYL